MKKFIPILVFLFVGVSVLMLFASCKAADEIYVDEKSSYFSDFEVQNEPKDISYESQMGEYDGVWAMYESLCFQGNGSVINYKKAIKRCRDDIMRI